MQSFSGRGLRASYGFLLLVAFMLVAGGCTGTTTMSSLGGSDKYAVDIKMDPTTLNPPQLGTLTFQVKDSTTNKVVTSFEAVSGALLHNIVLSKDLLYFRHDVALHSVRDLVSVPAFIPNQGTFYTYALYKPVGADEQTFKSTITSGSDSAAANLGPVWTKQDQGPQNRADSKLNVVKITNGLGVGWVKGSSSVKAGEPTQLLFHITERGEPVTGLWLNYDAPGHLWIVDESGNEFAHEIGAAESRVLLPSATPGEGTVQGNGSSSEPVPAEIPASNGTPVPPPTLIAPLHDALATVTAVPYPTLLPVQQTPAAGLTGLQLVRPGVGYGPDVVFTHNFPHEGYYKMWLEVKWQDEVVTTDFVVKVEK